MSTLATTNLKNPSSGTTNIVLNTDGSTTISAPDNFIKSGPVVTSTTGVAIDFTGIPSWVKRITVMFNGVSLSGTSSILVQVGTSSGVEATGYTAVCTELTNNPATTAATTGFNIVLGAAAVVVTGHLILTNVSGNVWVSSHILGRTDTAQTRLGGGTKTLSSTLDRVRITTLNGLDTFDAGTLNILYEG